MSTSSPAPPVSAGGSAMRERIAEHFAFSAASLESMQLADGTFCFEVVRGDRVPRGRSLRYTLMVLLGLRAAQARGHAQGWDLGRIEAALWREIDSAELDPGDLGLFLWDDARAGAGRGEELTRRLESALAAGGGLQARLGMELGWIVTGLAEQAAAGAPGAAGALEAALEQLLGPNRAPSGLFRHHGGPGRRARFPNFATQIYAVLALATAGRLGLDDRALPAARAAADRLVNLQLPDGGFPWFYDAQRGTVVERYEVYSVHQDAMAPMALLALADATGERRYVDAVGRGLRWTFGANELGQDMVDVEHGIVLRSIRRRRPWDRASLAARTAASLAGLPTPDRPARLVELNPTDRPYHFGWVLEAWSGREDVLDR